jgi:hypothetical protein
MLAQILMTVVFLAIAVVAVVVDGILLHALWQTIRQPILGFCCQFDMVALGRGRR